MFFFFFYPVVAILVAAGAQVVLAVATRRWLDGAFLQTGTALTSLASRAVALQSCLQRKSLYVPQLYAPRDHHLFVSLTCTIHTHTEKAYSLPSSLLLFTSTLLCPCIPLPSPLSPPRPPSLIYYISQHYKQPRAAQTLCVCVCVVISFALAGPRERDALCLCTIE